MSSLRTLTLAILLLTLTTTLASAADLTLKEVEKAPPADIAPALAGLLQPKALQLLDGETPMYEFWLVKQLPVKEAAAGAAALKAIEENTFIGVATVTKSTRDYRDEEVETGVFTMRFGLRPEDGNHQGTSEFLFFALLVPAAADKEWKTFASTQDLVKASSEGTSTQHPRILSLRPADSGGSPAELSTPVDEHKALRVSIPTDKSSAAVIDIVYEGTGHL